MNAAAAIKGIVFMICPFGAALEAAACDALEFTNLPRNCGRVARFPSFFCIDFE
jgi:hypothetical protein